ncbi:rab11 family-interacting protein 2 [Spea bombifrons]|uniref:rab11 family-interacting protein 2 n=1 Tax=Spea bombifrons TaxID=233779 RepID=UPI00234ACB0C|nr:rab11 family-interacting protein 2 [Spea bombifrons]XP_053306258.1 rab11 family-interacting protein 2 [Spea bombifrons]
MLEDAAQKWHPTHVQVTVLQARDLHPKGKHGTNDTYTIIQLGKEKYSTSVVEKSLHPVWKEEASFELPGLLVQDNPEQYQLQLSVMHRSLVSLDRFLGQVSINLNHIFENKERRKTEWFKLESKQGKKSKPRGELKVNIQFVRNNMTASMFDLSMRDKTRSPFARLKDRMKGRKADGAFSDTSSAIVPSTSDAPREPGGAELQVKDKPKKPFLLGPQRLSSAQSMSDLMGPQSSRVGAGGVPVKPPLGPISSAEEGFLKSPHRRTMSADTSQTGPAESTGGEWTLGGDPDPAPAAAHALPQKFATLPRQWAPYEDHGAAQDGSLTGSASLGLFSKPAEGKKEGRKKDKVSLFDRVTGKKEGKKSERPNHEDWSPDTRIPDGSSQPPADGYESTNPFAANFRMGGQAPEQRSHLRLSSSEAQVGSRARGADVSSGYPEEGVGLYRHLSRREVEGELAKHKELLRKKDFHIRELENYIDDLLVRVMEETPSILRVPYVPSRKAGKFPHA